MLQPKDTDWLKGYKNKTHIYAVYKKPTSELKTHTNQTMKTKHKERILKAAREKQVTYKGNPIRLTADLSVKTLQARKECEVEVAQSCPTLSWTIQTMEFSRILEWVAYPFSSRSF